VSEGKLFRERCLPGAGRAVENYWLSGTQSRSGVPLDVIGYEYRLGGIVATSDDSAFQILRCFWRLENGSPNSANALIALVVEIQLLFANEIFQDFRTFGPLNRLDYPVVDGSKYVEITLNIFERIAVLR
jgi:hypothetical protein